MLVQGRGALTIKRRAAVEALELTRFFGRQTDQYAPPSSSTKYLRGELVQWLFMLSFAC